MKKLVSKLLRDDSGANAVEFTLILPLLLIFLFGIIDGARLMWVFNMAEKATQAGVRVAAVTDMVPADLADEDFALDGGLVGGSAVPAGAVNGGAPILCTSTGCSAYGFNGTAFNRIAARVSQIFPAITPTMVRVSYQQVGLGYAGDPTGPDVAPEISVWVQGLTFRPSISLLWGGTALSLPGFRATMTMEDGQGATWN